MATRPGRETGFCNLLRTLKNSIYGKSKPLIDGERNDPKHQMRHYCGRATHAKVSSSEFVLEPCVDPLTHGPLFVALLLSPRYLRRRLGGKRLR